VNPRRSQFSLLIVRGDGARVVRFNFARPLAVSGCVAAVALLSIVGVLFGDWVQLRKLTREAVTFQRQIIDQRTLIEDMNRRVTDLRREVGTWREMHARIQEVFGPDAGRGGRDRGIGGRTMPTDRPTASADELDRLAETIAEESQSLGTLDRLMARAGKVLASLPSRWPIRGGVNSEYGVRPSPWTGNREFHAGIDIHADRGTAVHAPAAGTVVFAGPQPEYGNTVIVEHGQDIRSLYGHLSQTAVKPGQHVERGMLLAYSGNTGRSSGPHLHYEILVKGKAVNPRAYLWD
jgi:murein DD-endopeptidase MepM/ murein hydrolase activator NlpD